MPGALVTAMPNIPVCADQRTNEPFYVGNLIPRGLVEQRGIALLRVGEGA